MVSDSLVARLGREFERDRVLTGADVPIRYRLDALRSHRGSLLPEEGIVPAAVVLPRSTDEVSRLLRLAADLRVPVVPRGGGTGLMGGARPVAGAIVLDLRRMRRVRRMDVVAGTATAEAGIVLQELDRRLRRRGLFLGHDPWSQPRATLGGAIGTNGLGYTGYVHGSMGDQVLGLEAVLADGTIVRTRAVPRTTTGLDLRRLFIGTEGTLGVVTAATVKAFPKPQTQGFRAYDLPDFVSGFEAVCALYDDGLRPFLLDYGETFPARGVPWGSEDEPPTLFLGFAGARDLVSASWRIAGRHLRRARARLLPRREATAYWRTRHDVIFRLDEVAPGVTRADQYLKDVIFDYVHVALPRSKVLAFRRSALAALRRHGVSPIGLGIWTQPELVSIEMIRSVGTDRARDKEAVAAASTEVLRRVIALGGSIEYVHGVGLYLAPLLHEELGSGLEIQRRVKAALDPNGHLNPGKLGL